MDGSMFFSVGVDVWFFFFALERIKPSKDVKHKCSSVDLFGHVFLSLEKSEPSG